MQQVQDSWVALFFQFPFVFNYKPTYVKDQYRPQQL